MAVQTTGLAKSFGATQALRDCSLTLRAGEIHAIMGENGSGKSTLVKILSGVYPPDRGAVAILSGSVDTPSSPSEALAAGICTVFQEVLVAGQRSVLANVWLGTDGLFKQRRSPAAKRTRTREVLGHLLGDVPDLDGPVERLSLSGRQACCIARALVRDPKILILDEATSALDVATRANLFALLAGLRSTGVSVLFISHRMDEVEEIADRITVMRSGDTVASLRRGEAGPRELVRLMTGADHLVESESLGADAEARIRQEIVLTASAVRLRPDARPIDVEIRAGELVGLAGLEGHGQDTFLRVLAGVYPLAGEVVCSTDGKRVVLRSRAQASEHGIAYVPRDRRSESIFESRSILNNFELPTATSDRRHGVLHRSQALRRFERYVGRLGIVAGSRRHPITTLSGGNQQKVVIARWLATNPRILLLNDPTRGVDIATKRDIYGVLTEAATAGLAVVMLSTEIDEHLELMDRILVFREGELFAEIPSERATRSGLVASFFGRAQSETE